MKDKAVFVGLTIGDYDVGELFYYFDSSGVHEVDGATVVWFCEVLAFGEPGCEGRNVSLSVS